MENRNKPSRRSLGKLGEELACVYLAENGYSIAERNYRAGKLGEIDIIANEHEYICFIEVKARTGDTFGTPGEAVNRKKQENIRRLAMTYLKLKGQTDRAVRFDIAEVTGSIKDGSFIPLGINLIKNAF